MASIGKDTGRLWGGVAVLLVVAVGGLLLGRKPDLHVGQNADVEHDAAFLPRGQAGGEPVSGAEGGGLSIAAHVDRNCSAMSLADVHLFAVCQKELVAFDVSQPAAPVEVGSYSFSEDIVAVAATESYAYLFDSWRNFIVVDVGTPKAMTVVSNNAVMAGNPYAMEYVNGIVLVAENPYPGVAHGVRVLDVSDPQSPSMIGVRPLSRYAATDMKVVGDRAYVATRSTEKQYGDFLVLDGIYGPGIDIMSSHVPVVGEVAGVAITGTLGVITVFSTERGMAELQLVDIAEEREPYMRSAFSYPDTATVMADEDYVPRIETPILFGVVVIGDDAVSVEVHHGMQRPEESAPTSTYLARQIDLSDPDNPSSMGVIEVGGRQDIAAVGDYAYISGHEEGIDVVAVP